MPKPGAMVDYYSPQAGAVLQVPAAQAEIMREGGYAVGPEAKVAYESSGVGATIKASLYGFLHGASFHTSDLLMPDSLKGTAEALRKYHPYASGAGEMVGGAAPFIGAAAAATAAVPAIGTSLVAGAALDAAVGAVGAGTETAVEASKTDTPLTAEHLLASVGIGAALAGILHVGGHALSKALPAAQRSANKYIKGLVDKGYYGQRAFKPVLETPAQRATSKAASDKIIDELGGVEGIFGRKAEAGAPQSGIGPDVETAAPAATSSEAPPPLPGEGLPSHMQPTAEEREIFAGQGYEPDSKWSEEWGRSDEGFAHADNQRAHAAGMYDGPEPAATSTPAAAASEPAPETWDDYKGLDFSKHVSEVPPSTPRYREKAITDQDKQDMLNMGYNPDRAKRNYKDPSGENWESGRYVKTGSGRPYQNFARFVREGGTSLSVAGLAGHVLDAKSFGLVGTVRGALGVTAGRAISSLDNVALYALNNQRSINATLDHVIFPVVRGIGNVAKSVVQSKIPEIAQSSTVFGSNDIDGTFEAAQTALPKLTTDPNALASHYSNVYGAILNNQPALHQNLVAASANGINYLSGQLPLDPRPPSIVPSPYNPSRAEKVAFLHKLAAVNDPVGAMQNPTLEGMEAIKATYPLTLKMAQQQLLTHLSQMKKPLTSRQAQHAALLLQAPVNQATDPHYIASLQSIARGQQSSQGGAAGGKSGPKHKSSTVNKSAASMMAAPSQQNEVENAT